ncbi:MAG: hypothetical protein ACRCVT_04330 [Leadbetterella sp.]
MAESKRIFISKEWITAKHIRSKQWINYEGTLKVYDRKVKSVTLKIKSEVYDSFIAMEMDDEKEFSGNSVTEVYQKLSSWFDKKGVIF